MAKYTLLLQRDSEHKDVKHPKKDKLENSTLGTITLTENESGKVLFKGYTCENIGPSTDTPNQDKRIVARTYKIQWTDSSTNSSLSKTYPKYKIGERNKAIWLHNPEDPNFAKRRILIHVGNYPQDTAGCLLVGQTRNTAKGTISSSILAIHSLYEIIEKIDIKEIDLVVKEIG